MARRYPRAVQGPKRTTVWIGFNVGYSILVGSSLQLIASLNAAALALRPFTVIRTRLDMHFGTDQEAADELPSGAMGLIVVNDKAAAAGIASVPTPITDQGSDLWYLFAEQYGKFGGTAVEEQGRLMQVDSKGMRKVEDGQDNIIALETPSFVNSAVSIIGGRTLIKLH